MSERLIKVVLYVAEPNISAAKALIQIQNIIFESIATHSNVYFKILS